MKFIPVNATDHASILFELLKERNEKINISHSEMPDFDKHIEFVEFHPYREWNIIEVDSEIIGSIYISAFFEIGIFIFEKYQGYGYGENAVKKLIKENKYRKYFANINPENEKSIYLFKKLGFKLIQHTYSL